MKLLFVEDNAEMSVLLRDLLSEVPGLEIAGEAGDVPEAIELVRTLRPDVVIVDIGLPSGSGVTVLREAKQMQPVPVVIMLSSLRAPEYRAACRKAGADHFFEKTTGLPELYRTLEELAGTSASGD
jgi:DNA-binding NarL/FixJ family response regulator